MRTSDLGVLIGSVAALQMAAAPSAGGQFWDRLSNPRFDVPIKHPPQIVLKNVTKVSVLEFDGNNPCGPELTVRLSHAIATSGQFELIDREHIGAVLRERGFQATGAFNGEAAIKLGELIGPAAIFAGKVTRCSVQISGLLKEGDYKDSNGNVMTKYIRRTTAHITASVSLIDLTTGKVYAGDLLDISETLTNEAFNAAPEAPSEDAVWTRMYQRAVNQVRLMIMPWTEVVSLTVFDEAKCDLKKSTAQMRRGDFSQAAETMQAAISNTCGVPNDKNLLSKAYYNLGIALTYSDRDEDGLKALLASSDLRSTKIANEAIAAVRKIIQLREAQRVKEVDAAELGTAVAAQKAVAAPLTNQDVIDMVRAKLSDAIIVAKIKSSPCKFDVSASGLIALKQAGASDAVILAITESKCK